MSVVRVTLCAFLVGVGLARGAVEVPPLTPEAHDAVAAYLRDPSGNAKAFLDAARQQGGDLNPVQALLLGDAAVRAGLYRTAGEFFMTVQDAGLASAAQMGLAWASLGLGKLNDAYEHFDAAAAADASLRPIMDFAMALVAAANGSPGGREALATALAQDGIDPAFREAAPLLDAYARYWGGDAAGAADAFTAFAVANPDSRFADDALYAAAQAKLRAGREDEAQADLESLAGDQPPQGRLSSRLVALDGRAVLREGMRRDRDRPTRLFPRRLVDLLDGDGVRLAQAALAAPHPHDKPDAGEAPGARNGAPGHIRHAGAENGNAPAYPAGAAPTAPAHGSAPDTVTDDSPAHGARFPWTILLALALPLALLAAWLLARGGRPDQARSR